MDTMDDQKIKAMVLGDVIDYPVKWPGSEQAVYPEKGYGLCDDEMWDSRNGAVGFRFFKYLLTLTVAAGAGLEWDAGAEMTFFGNKGQEEDGSSSYPADYVLTESETDAYKNGAMVSKEDSQFFIYSLGFQVGKPFVMDATDGEAPLDTTPNWTRGYNRELQEKVSNAFGVQFHWPDTKCEYGMGLIKDWPAHSDTVGSDIPAMSNRTGGLGMWSMRRPVIGGYRTSEDLVSITAKSGFGMQLPNDVAFPIPAVAEPYSYVIPVVLKTYGVAVKRNRCMICIGGEATTVDQLARIIAKRLQGGN